MLGPPGSWMTACRPHTLRVFQMGRIAPVRLGDVERWKVVNQAAAASELGRKTPSRCMYHCHILQHEDEAMMGQFLIVAA